MVLRVSSTVRLGAGQRVGPGPGVGGHPGHPAEQVERGALGGQQRPGRAGDRREHVAADHPVAVAAPAARTGGRAAGRQRRRPPRRPAARRPRRRPGPPVGGVDLVGRDGRLAGHVDAAGAEILGERVVDDPLDRPPGRARPPAASSCDLTAVTASPPSCVGGPAAGPRAASRWPRHSSRAVGKSSRQWQPRVSSPGVRRPRPARAATVSRLVASQLAVCGAAARRASSAQRPRRCAASDVGDAQHAGPAGHRPLQRRPDRRRRPPRPVPSAGRRPASACGGRSPARCRRRSAGRRPAPPAASCWPAGWRRARRCRPPRRRRTGPGWRCGRAGRCGRRRRRSGPPARPGSGRWPGRRRRPGRTPRSSGTAGPGTRRRGAGRPGRRGRCRSASITRWMPLATTSRGASSASSCWPTMNRLPSPSTRYAPSPRSASLTSGCCAEVTLAGHEATSGGTGRTPRR